MQQQYRNYPLAAQAHHATATPSRRGPGTYLRPQARSVTHNARPPLALALALTLPRALTPPHAL